MTKHSVKGRGTGLNPGNRFETRSYELIEEEYDPVRKLTTNYYRDANKSALVRNESPDIGFSYDVNPYRGCEHGCVYCYARPTHEYLGFSSGLDFETKIMVKPDIHLLLEKEFQKKTGLQPKSPFPAIPTVINRLNGNCS